MEIGGNEFEGRNVDVQIVTLASSSVHGQNVFLIYILCWSGLRNLAFRTMDHTKRLGLLASGKSRIKV